MRQVIEETKELNKKIQESKEYRAYIETKKVLKENTELCNKLDEFRAKNYELQNKTIENPYDEVNELVREYDELLHNTIVSDFLKSERRICRMMREVYYSIAEELEFDYLNE